MNRCDDAMSRIAESWFGLILMTVLSLLKSIPIASNESLESL